MKKGLHNKCESCGILLSSMYPYMLCPKCWEAKYHAPPGECRIDYFEAAAKQGEIFHLRSYPYLPLSLLRVSCLALMA
jgi:hypothetical protein